MSAMQVIFVLPLIVLLVVVVCYSYYRILTRLRRKRERLERRGPYSLQAQLTSAGGVLADQVQEGEAICTEVASVLRIEPEWMRLEDRFLVELGGNREDGSLFDETELIADVFADQCRARGLPMTQVPATVRDYLEYLLGGGDKTDALQEHRSQSPG